MLPRIRRLAMITLLILVFATAASSTTVFSSPGIEGRPQAGTQFNITVATGQISSPVLKYRRLGSPFWRSCQVKNGRCRFNGLDQGIYEYYFINGTNTSTRFPQRGTLRLALSDGIALWRNIAKNFTKANPTDNDFTNGCVPWDKQETLRERFSCGFEHMQGAMISGMGQAYLMTRNQTYLRMFRNLSLREYDETGKDRGSESFATCDINNSDFSCENRSNLLEAQGVPGGRRQAALIHSLSRYGRLLNRSTIKRFGRRYMAGDAQGCTIWEGDYSCSTAAGQGFMTGAAWSSFLTTGNKTIRAKAEKLSRSSYRRSLQIQNRTNFTAFHLISGLFQSYAVTGNASYRKQARALATDDLPVCSNRSATSPCSVENHSLAIKAALSGYRATGNHYYLQQAYNLLQTNFSGICNPWNNSFQCDWADEQGLATSAFWNAYRTVPKVNTSFYSPRINGKRQSGQKLTFTVGMRGDLPDPDLWIRKTNKSWRSCDIWLVNGSCTVGSSFFAEQTVYRYRFNGTGVTFPKKGSFRLLLAHRNDSLQEQAQLLTANASDDCNPAAGDYSCEREHWQAWMIRGYRAGYIFTSNRTFRQHSIQLATSAIGGLTQICAHTENDFFCDPGGGETPPTGSVRQGLLIEQLWEAYLATGNATIKELARNYTRSHPNDCNVWQHDFTCGSQRGQGSMIQGYQAAYMATGNITYLSIASNLSAASLEFNTTVSEVLATALWQQYSITRNTSFRNATRNVTAGLIQDCANGSCTTVNYSQVFDLGMTAYMTTVNNTYYNLSYQVLFSGNSGSCDPWQQDYKCLDADQQGALTATFWQAFAYDRVSVDGETGFNVTETSVTVGEAINATCSVTNTVANGSDLLDVNVTITAPGFNVSGNRSVLLGTIVPGASMNTTWTLEATSSGTHQLQCDAFSSNDWRGSAARIVDVASPDTGGSGGGGGTGGGGGGFGGAPPEDTGPETANTSFGFAHQDTMEELEQLLDERAGLSESLEALLGMERQGVNRSLRYTVKHVSCLQGTRNISIIEGATMSWLTVDYTCDQFIRQLTLYDRVPDSNATRTRSRAASVTLGQQPPAHAFIRSNITQGDGITVRYQINGTVNLSSFQRPVAILTNSTKTPDSDPPDITLLDIGTVNTTKQFIQFAVNVTDQHGIVCNVTKNGVLQLRRVEEISGINTSLDQGFNRFRITCRDERDNVATEQFTILRQPDRDGQASQRRPLIQQIPLQYLSYLVLFLVAGGVLGALVTGYRQRDRFIRQWQEYRLQQLIEQLEQRFQEEDFVAVIDLYEQVRDQYIDIHGEAPDIGFWHRHIGDLGMTLRIYLLLDLAVRRARKGEIEKVLDSIDNLQGLYSRFKQRNPSHQIQDRIEEKARELDTALQRQAGAHFNY
ncbi:MAG: hypothetical protein SVU32_08035 [Candidatus Nanohaloarchaea archaeon]|nr:hypothetical protein [Candidatus Nanohaloarchaea archaeon]